MGYQVVMPQLGMTMTEGAVLRWLKGPGDRVEKGEPLFEVQTDKVEMEVEAPCSGVLTEVLVPVEQVVPVGSPVAVITGGTDGQADGSPAPVRAESPAPSPPPATSNAAPATPPRPAARGDHGTGEIARSNWDDARRISPRARRVAAEHGVNAADLTAWKAGGRIVEADVRAYLARQAPARPGAAAGANAGVRQVIAQRMTESFRDIPHFYLSSMVDATELSKLRAQLLPVIEQQTGTRLSYLDLFVRAAALALRSHPEVNASWEGGRIVSHAGVHVGFAAQFGDRLLTPVVRDAALLALPALARRRAELVDRGRAGRLTPDDLEGATFTVSNLGPFGVDQFQAIVVPPQSAILAVGRVAPRPVANDGRVRVRETVWLTLSVDHRVLDGALAAGFLRDLVSMLESPYRMLMAGGDA